jgi:hypothetical protein
VHQVDLAFLLSGDFKENKTKKNVFRFYLNNLKNKNKKMKNTLKISKALANAPTSSGIPNKRISLLLSEESSMM